MADARRVNTTVKTSVRTGNAQLTCSIRSKLCCADSVRPGVSLTKAAANTQMYLVTQTITKHFSSSPPSEISAENSLSQTPVPYPLITDTRRQCRRLFPTAAADTPLLERMNTRPIPLKFQYSENYTSLNTERKYFGLQNPRFPKKNRISEGPPRVNRCPSGKGDKYIKQSMEDWYNDTDSTKNDE